MRTSEFTTPKDRWPLRALAPQSPARVFPRVIFRDSLKSLASALHEVFLFMIFFVDATSSLVAGTFFGLFTWRADVSKTFFCQGGTVYVPSFVLETVVVSPLHSRTLSVLVGVCIRSSMALWSQGLYRENTFYVFKFRCCIPAPLQPWSQNVRIWIRPVRMNIRATWMGRSQNVRIWISRTNEYTSDLDVGIRRGLC